MAKTSPKEKKSIELYFPHDIATRQDGSIIKLLMELSWEGYGLWWAIVEYMHRNDFAVTDESIIAFELRSNKDVIHKIMNDFGLFRIENGFYISDRILRNLDYRETKSEQAQDAANTKWLLINFNKEYEKEFGAPPAPLTQEEINTLKRHNNKTPDFKAKLPDIIYTLKGLKFVNNKDFKPCANWLLAKNHLEKLLNGEFGKLKHRKTEKEIKEEKRRATEESRSDSLIDSICNKIDAIEYVAENAKEVKGRMFFMPHLKDLMKKFEITEKEIEKYRND